MSRLLFWIVARRWLPLRVRELALWGVWRLSQKAQGIRAFSSGSDPK